MQVDVVIKNEEGLHARPAATLVQAANKFESEITIHVGEKEASAKSIMGLMGLGLQKDSAITIKAAGSDQDLAIKSLADLVNNQFNIEY